MELTCSVCETRNEKVRPCASPLGPYSLAYCVECAERGAQPLDDLIERAEKYPSHFTWITWKDGKYFRYSVLR